MEYDVLREMTKKKIFKKEIFLWNIEDFDL